MIQELIKKYGRIDILVNNAGITRDGLLMKMSEEDFDAVVNTNLKGAFNTIRHMSRFFLGLPKAWQGNLPAGVLMLMLLLRDLSPQIWWRL